MNFHDYVIFKLIKKKIDKVDCLNHRKENGQTNLEMLVYVIKA